MVKGMDTGRNNIGSMTSHARVCNAIMPNKVPTMLKPSIPNTKATQSPPIHARKSIRNHIPQSGNVQSTTTSKYSICASILATKSALRSCSANRTPCKLSSSLSICPVRCKPNTEANGSLPCLRPAYHIDSKGLRSGIDLCRIPHKMLETPASHKEEPDAWILSVSKPGLNYQNSG